MSNNRLILAGIIGRYPLRWELGAIAGGKIDLTNLTAGLGLEMEKECEYEYERTSLYGNCHSGMTQ